MCDKIVISAYMLKIVERDPFLRLQRRAREISTTKKKVIVTNFLSTNKQCVNIKLMQNETNMWSSFSGNNKILVKL